MNGPSEPSDPAVPSIEDAAGAGTAGSPAVGGDLPEAFVIPRALAQATLNYLATQPYREVFQLVQGFESLVPLPSTAGPRERSQR